MIDALQTWLLGITAAALCIALAEQLVIQPGIKRVLRLAGGVILLIVLLGPLNRLSESHWDFTFTNPAEEQEALEEELRESGQTALQQGIAETLAAYIWDKGRSLGADCEVSVAVSMDETGIPVIETVTLAGGYHDLFSKWLEEEMGVPREDQIWQEKQGEE